MLKLKSIEFYTSPFGEVMVKPEGAPVHILEETGQDNREFINAFISYMSIFYTQAWNALRKEYSRKEPNRLNYEFWIVSRFIRCNFSEYDYNSPDIDLYGRFHFEEVRCPLRGECSLEHVCCKPTFNTTLSFRETEVLRLIIQRHEADGIAEQLHISPHTVNNHRRNIHIKTNTRNIAELVEYWHTHQLK